MSVKISIFGSSNKDFFFSVNKQLKTGETITGEQIKFCPGGKGLNTCAVVANILKDTDTSEVYFVNQVGDDDSAKFIKEQIEPLHMNRNFVTSVKGPSGTAYIFLLPNGDNSIVVIPGANDKWECDYDKFVQKYQEPLKAEAILMQREINDAVNDNIAKYTKNTDTVTMFDFGGKDTEIKFESLANYTFISPNSTELRRVIDQIGDEVTTNCDFYVKHEKLIEAYLTEDLQKLEGYGITDQKPVEFHSEWSDDQKMAYIGGIVLLFYIRQTKDTKLKGIVLKCGSEGSIYVEDFNKYVYQPIFKGNKAVVDTTGCGDCFTGSFVTSYMLLRNKSKLEGIELIDEALKYGNAFGYVCATKVGTLDAMPGFNDLKEYWPEFKQRFKFDLLD